jgi:hypothetical protein
MSEFNGNHPKWYTTVVAVLAVALTLLVNHCYNMATGEDMGDIEISDTIWRVRDIDREMETGEVPTWWRYQCGMVDGIEGWVTKSDFDSYDEAREFLDAAYHEIGADGIPNNLDIVEFQLVQVEVEQVFERMYHTTIKPSHDWYPNYMGDTIEMEVFAKDSIISIVAHGHDELNYALEKMIYIGPEDDKIAAIEKEINSVKLIKKIGFVGVNQLVSNGFLVR